MKAMTAIRATKAMKAKPGALTTTGDNSSVAKSIKLGLIKLKPKYAAKALPMKAMAAMSAKKTTNAMKAKKSKTEVVYRLITKSWPTRGHKGEIMINVHWQQHFHRVTEYWLVPERIPCRRKRNRASIWWTEEAATQAMRAARAMRVAREMKAKKKEMKALKAMR